MGLGSGGWVEGRGPRLGGGVECGAAANTGCTYIQLS